MCSEKKDTCFRISYAKSRISHECSLLSYTIFKDMSTNAIFSNKEKLMPFIKALHKSFFSYS